MLTVSKERKYNTRILHKYFVLIEFDIVYKINDYNNNKAAKFKKQINCKRHWINLIAVYFVIFQYVEYIYNGLFNSPLSDIKK